MNRIRLLAANVRISCGRGTQRLSSSLAPALVLALVLGLAACSATSSTTAGQGNTPEATATATATATPLPTATPRPTATPIPTAPPTATPVPFPNIAGVYTGSWTNYGQPGSNPMQIQIDQSGQTLGGHTTEGQTSNNSGTISANGSFSITETWPNGSHSYLNGSIVGQGHLSGTWNAGGSALGTWDVHQ